jgi:hypothetical protein
MGNASALAAVGRHVAALRALAGGDEFITEVAAECADVIETELQRTSDANQDPYGRPLAKRKQDGRAAMVGYYQKHVRVDPIGNTVIIRLRNKHAVLHHFGDGRGNDVPRMMIPTEGVPQHWLPKIRGAAVKAFGRRLEVQR